MHKKNVMRIAPFIVLLLLPLALFAEKAVIDSEPKVEPPWLTGPLLAPSATAIPAPHYNIEPYFYAIANTGFYNNQGKVEKRPTLWNNSFQPLVQIGLTSWLDCQINPVFFYNTTRGVEEWGVGDMPVAIDIQLYQSHGLVTDWTTALKLSLREVLPIGKYRHLDPRKLGTDLGGQGSWQTSLNLVWGNLLYLGGKHFFDFRVSLEYTLPAPVHVVGFNAYGGGVGTNGTVYPAQNFDIDIGMELTLTQNWTFALDVTGAWFLPTRFKGEPGVTPTGGVANNAPKASSQYTLAPALEYNWSSQLGIIGGVWFTVAGHNTPAFTGGILAVNYYH